MQQIERYGVIALVFLLVTIVAVSFWGDSKSPGFWSRLTGRGVPKKEELALAPATSERALDQALPLSPGAGVVAPASGATPPSPQPGASVAIEPAAAQGAQPFGANGSGSAPAFAGSETGASAPAPLDTLHGRNTEMPPDAAPQSFARTTPPAPTSTNEVHVVQKGESLALIAARKLGDEKRWPEIAAVNGGLDPKRVQVGQKLVLPAGATSAPGATRPSVPGATRAGASGGTRASTAQSDKAVAKKAAAPSTSKSKPSTGGYVVRSGDTLRAIAERKLGDADRWKEIVALNPGLDPNRIPVGRSLRLPAGESSAVLASAAPVRQVVRSDKPVVR